MNDRMKLFIANEKFTCVLLQKRHRHRSWQVVNFYPRLEVLHPLCYKSPGFRRSDIPFVASLRILNGDRRQG